MTVGQLWGTWSILKKLVAVVLIGIGVIVVVWIYSWWSGGKYRAEMEAWKTQAAVSAALAETHRKAAGEAEARADTYEAAMKAKDALTAANAQDRRNLNEVINAETAKLEAEIAAGPSNLPPDELRRRLCERLGARLKAYCAD